MASYPGSVATFTTHVNVTEVIDAGHPNAIQSEVVAIESALGTSPSLATAASASGWSNTATDYTTVTARLANIEKGIVSDTHTQYLRKASDGGNIITPSAGTNRGLVIQAASGQSVNLQEWKNSSGTVVSYVDASGTLSGASATSTNAGLQDVFLFMGA
jgi:hypothetical protein